MTPKSTWRAIYASLWGDAWFRKLTPPKPSAQLLWLYLKTGPHTTSIECLFRASEASLADELGWSLEDFRACWREIEGSDKGKADWSARVVWLPDEMGDGTPSNSDIILGWERLVPAIPECSLKDEACNAIAAHCLGRATAENLPKWQAAVRRVFGNHTVSDTLPHTVSDTVSDTLPDTKNKTRTNTRSKKKNKTPPPTPSVPGEEKSGEDSFPSEEEEDEDEIPDDPKPVTPPDDTTGANAEVARRLGAHYDAAVKPKHCGTGVGAIRDRLLAGESEERLLRAADVYAVELDAEGKEPRYRQTANTFYGTGPRAKYPAYRDRTPQVAVSASERPDLVPVASRLLAMYSKSVCSSHPEAGAEAKAIALLAGGTSEETHLKAVGRYANHCERRRLAADARKGAPAFFGVTWKEYAPPPAEPMLVYEPQSIITKEELMARPHLIAKVKGIINFFEQEVHGTGYYGNPSLLVARILLDGVQPVELMAACEGYAGVATKARLACEDRIRAPQFFAGEWQRYRGHPPSPRTVSDAERWNRTEEEMERDRIAWVEGGRERAEALRESAKQRAKEELRAGS